LNNNDITRNIQKLVIFFSLCFFSLIVYLTYFSFFVAGNIINDPTNKRVRIAESKVLRGSILDRNGEIVTYSKREGESSQKRYYKYGAAFAHATGYNSYIYGKTGVERAYNSVLQGETASFDFLASVFKNLKENLAGDEKRGNDVLLTIDKDVQNKAYNMLGKDRGAVVALNPKTGEILGMVSTPSYNPEIIDKQFKNYVENEEETPLFNRAAKGSYPPGSVFKIITAVSALENIPDITKNVFSCTGKLKIGGYVLSDFGGRSHGEINLQKAFEESCNYTFGQLGITLGSDNLKTTAEKFMFNRVIDDNDQFDILDINEGKIPSEEDKNKSYLAQDAIGQHNVTANPMQMALVASAIANDGVMMKPFLVKEVRDRYGVSLNQTSSEVLTEVTDKPTADIIEDYMVKVVKAGTGTNARISGITVAGKTGSAQDEKKNATHSWFVAFAPAENPEIALAVIVENGGVGGKRAAEVAREVIKSYLKK
jgi:penicillin-binding protein A